MTLANAIVLEVVVKHRHYNIGAFPSVDTLVHQEVDLLGECLACHSKETTLPRALEINRTRLQRVRWEMHLLGEVETVMVSPSKAAFCVLTECDVSWHLIFHDLA